MKVIKDKNIELNRDRNFIVNNYRLVDNDYSLNTEEEDITNIYYLSIFLSINKLDKKILKESLEYKYLPIWSELDDSTRIDLLYFRVYPPEYALDDFVGLLPISEIDSIKTNKDAVEYIQDIERRNSNYFYFETKNQQNTNSTEYQEFYNFDNDFRNAFYEIEFNAVFGNDKKSGKSYVRFSVDGENIGQELMSEIQGNRSDFILSARQLSGLTDIKVEFKSEKGSAYISYLSILIKQI